MIRINGMQADENALRRLIESGAISPQDLSGVTMSGSMGYTPEPQMPAQSAPQPPAKTMRVLGYDPSVGMVSLGEEAWAAPKLDYTRPGIEIAGLGKGYYSRDGGSAYIQNGDGGMTRVVLGYNDAGSRRRQAEDRRMRKDEAEIAQTLEQTQSIRQTREQGKTMQPQWSNELQAWVTPPTTQNPGGTIMRPTGGGDGDGVPGKLTDSQGNALTYGMRAANSHEILNSIGQDGKIQPGLLKRSVSGLPVVGDALGLMTNWTQTTEQQMVEQAQRDFINAILRRESGAVISPSEFQNAALQYFPQPNDDPPTVALKKRNRQLAIEGLAYSAGPGRKKVLDMAEKSRALFEAQIAIRRGADPAKVRARLQQMGIEGI